MRRRGLYSTTGSELSGLDFTKGIYTDGANDRMVTSAGITLSASYTFSIWFKFDTTLPGNFDRLFSNDFGNSQNLTQLYYETTGQSVRCLITKNNSAVALFEKVISGFSANTLYHFVIRRNFTGSDYQYSFECSNKLTLPFTITPSTVNDANEQTSWERIAFGTNLFNLARSINGTFVASEFYDYALTDSQWQQLYNQQVLSIAPIHRWQFNLVTSNITNDEIGTLHLTCTDMISNPVVNL